MAFLRQSSALDITIATRIMNLCWICALPGCFILQFNLLTHTWHQYPHALFIGFVVSAWLAGSALCAIRPPATLRLWGWLFAGCGFLPLVSPLTPASIVLPFLPLGEEIALAFLAGWIMSAWLTQRRPWPQPVEHVTLAMGVVSGLGALIIVWNMPSPLWSTGCGLLLLMPLLVLDMWFPSTTPLPRAGGMLERWSARAITGGMVNRPLQLARTTKSHRPLSFLAMRRRILLTCVASYTTILTGTFWSIAPIPFAAELVASHHMDVLTSLFVGMLVALVIGWSLLAGPARGILGRIDHPLPEKWQLPLQRYSFSLILIMAISLIALSFPFLHEHWELVGIMTSYTLAAFLWGMVLPRLRPTLTIELQAQRHVFSHPALSYTLPILQAQEDRANYVVRMLERCLLIILIPISGWLIDIIGVALLLRATGVLLALLSVATLIAIIILPYTHVATRHTPEMVKDLLSIERPHAHETANAYPASVSSRGRS